MATIYLGLFYFFIKSGISHPSLIPLDRAARVRTSSEFGKKRLLIRLFYLSLMNESEWDAIAR
jgi:hypothetical protein